MVEMKEARNAIAGATEHSLILFDELGRGTATYDGMSLAQSILEYISKNIHAFTLFSTHYHELTRLDKNFKNIKNVHVSAVENGNEITFLHKIKNGSVDKSYGIHVARLAKMPDELLNRAQEILDEYETNSKKKNPCEKVQLAMDFDVQEKKEDIIKKTIRFANFFCIFNKIFMSKAQTCDTDPPAHTPSLGLGTVLCRRGLHRGLSSF